MRPSALTLEPELTPAERALLLDTLRRCRPDGPHLEIGTAAGGSLREMMRVYEPAERPPFVVVDPFSYFPDQRAIVARNLASHGLDPSTVDFRVGESAALLPAALGAGDRFAFIFIDGNHKARYVMQDLGWTRLLTVGGLVALHDHKPKFRGVMWATARFLARNPHFERMAEAESLVILRKTRQAARPEVSPSDVTIAGLVQPILRVRRSLEKRIGRWIMAG